MPDIEEQALQAMKRDYSEVSIPDSLDSSIHLGIQRVQAERSKQKGQLWAVLAASLMLLVLMGTIRVSPVFASWVSSIPGMEKNRQADRRDNGLKLAVHHDFMQPVGLSDEHDGIRLTVDGIIVDEVRMNIFYTIENPSALFGIAYPKHLGILDAVGKELVASYAFGYPGTDEEKKSRTQQQRVDIQMANDHAMPDKVQLLIRYEGFDQPWKVTIPVDRERFKNMQQVYPLHQAVEIDGQKFTVTKAIINPTEISVDIQFDETNTQKIFGFRDVALVDDKGEKLMNTGASHESDHAQILHFQSNFFDMPEHLYLEGSTLTALPKDKLELVIDPKTLELVKAPDQRLKLESPTNDMNLQVTLDGIVDWDHMMYALVGTEFKDDTGKSYKVLDTRSWHSRAPGEPWILSFAIPNEPYGGLLHFQIEDYPAYLRQNFRVTLK